MEVDFCREGPLARRSEGAMVFGQLLPDSITNQQNQKAHFWDTYITWSLEMNLIV